MSLKGRKFKFHDTLTFPSSKVEIYNNSYAELFENTVPGGDWDKFAGMSVMIVPSEMLMVQATDRTDFATYMNGEWKTNFSAHPQEIVFVSEPDNFFPDETTFMTWFNANADEIIIPYLTNDIELASVADAIRAKGGTSSSLSYPLGFIDAISNISGSSELESMLMTRDSSFTSFNDSTYTALGDGTFACFSTLEEITMAVSKIGSYAFLNCTGLISASFPECIEIGSSAFQSCFSLATINASKCETLGDYAFASCSSLTEVSFPACSYIGSAAFYSCINLSSAYFPSVEVIGSNAFTRCLALVSVSFQASVVSYFAFGNCFNLINISLPSCKTIGNYGFAYCSAISSIELPLCETLGNYVFTSCYSLVSVSLPNCISIGSWAFNCCSSLLSINLPACAYANISYLFAYCSNLSYISMPICSLSPSPTGINPVFGAPNLKFANIGTPSIAPNLFRGLSLLESCIFSSCEYIGQYAFYSCSKLSAIYLLGSSYATLYDGTVFQNTPMQYSSYIGTFGSIYVPSSMVDTYKTMQNWSLYSNRFVGV